MKEIVWLIVILGGCAYGIHHEWGRWDNYGAWFIFGVLTPTCTILLVREGWRTISRLPPHGPKEVPR